MGRQGRRGQSRAARAVPPQVRAAKGGPGGDFGGAPGHPRSWRFPVSGTLEVVGCLGAAGALSVSFLVSDARLRVAGLVLAGALALALIAGQGWDDIRNLRQHHLEFAGLVVAGIIVLALGAAGVLRWPILLPLLVIATLPFRVRLHVAGGEAVNLLVPLYVVIGCGVLATRVGTTRGPNRHSRRAPAP